MYKILTKWSRQRRPPACLCLSVPNHQGMNEAEIRRSGHSLAEWRELLAVMDSFPAKSKTTATHSRGSHAAFNRPARPRAYRLKDLQRARLRLANLTQRLRMLPPNSRHRERLHHLGF